MAEMTKEDVYTMVNNVVSEALAPMIEKMNFIDSKGEVENVEKKDMEKPEEISDEVKQYLEDKKNGTFSGRNVEAVNNRSYNLIEPTTLDIKPTNESVLTGKKI